MGHCVSWFGEEIGREKCVPDLLSGDSQMGFSGWNLLRVKQISQEKCNLFCFSRVVNHRLDIFPLPLDLHLPQRIPLQGFGALDSATLSKRVRLSTTRPWKPALLLLGLNQRGAHSHFCPRSPKDRVISGHKLLPPCNTTKWAIWGGESQKAEMKVKHLVLDPLWRRL